MHVTPTAVSHQVRQLEELLGRPLFRRHPRPVRLTPAGQVLFPAIREGFDRIGSGVGALGDPASAGPVVITTTPAFASRWLIPRLGALRAACGGQSFAVEASEKVIDLRAGAAELAIRYQRTPDPYLVCEPLITDRYLPVARPALLARAGDIRRPSDLVRLPLIHFDWKRQDPNAPTWSRWLDRASEAFPDDTIPAPDQGLRFSEEIHAIEAAIEGQGVALVSDFLVARELRQGLLVPAFNSFIEGLTFYVMYPPEVPRREIIEQAVAAMVAESGGTG